MADSVNGKRAADAEPSAAAKKEKLILDIFAKLKQDISWADAIIGVMYESLVATQAELQKVDVECLSLRSELRAERDKARWSMEWTEKVEAECLLLSSENAELRVLLSNDDDQDDYTWIRQAMLIDSMESRRGGCRRATLRPGFIFFTRHMDVMNCQPRSRQMAFQVRSWRCSFSRLLSSAKLVSSSSRPSSWINLCSTKL